MSLSQFVVDLNLRKSWLVASRFDPDVVIFMGDLMDNGRLTSSDEECVSFSFKILIKKLSHIVI